MKRLPKAIYRFNATSINIPNAFLVAIEKPILNTQVWLVALRSKEIWGGHFPGGPVVRTPRFHCQGCRFDPGRGTKVLQAMRCGQKKKKEGNFFEGAQGTLAEGEQERRGT